MVLRPEDGEQETKEKHHQAKANQADDCKKTKTDLFYCALLVRSLVL